MTVAHRTPTDSRLAAVLDAYGLTPSGLCPLSGGMENTHVLAETPHGLFVITQLRKKTLAAAEEYARFLDRLEQADIPAPRLRRRRDGGGWVTTHAGHPVIVCGHIPGRHLAVLPPQLVEDVGTFLGRTHRTVTVPNTTLTPHLRMNTAEEALLANLPDTGFARWARATHRDVAHVTAQSQSAPTVAVHADAFPDNILVTDGGVVLLDWEDCSADLPVIDVGMALIGLCCSADRFSVRRARRLVHGYRTASGISLDTELLRDAALHAALLVALRRYQWRQQGHLPAEPSRSHTTLARSACDLKQHWAAVPGR